MSDPMTTLLLLRHGEVASHRGDVPVTEEGLAHAVRTGKAIGGQFGDSFAVLYGGTRRTRETAEAVIEGIGPSTEISGPTDAFALRNPDLYVAGTRVNMVSSAATLAEQVPGMTEEQAAKHDWFAQFFSASDRIGWWLEQDTPPGDNADRVATRIINFAQSLTDDGPFARQVVIGTTHSPVLRSVIKAGTGTDPGEPGYVTGALLRISHQRTVTIEPFDPLSS